MKRLSKAQIEEWSRLTEAVDESLARWERHSLTVVYWTQHALVTAPTKLDTICREKLLRASIPVR